MLDTLRGMMLFIASLCALAAGAPAEEFPSRPIRLLVGFSAGGSNDLIGRAVAAKLSDRLGKQVLVDNRPGAAGIVASEIVAAAPPDGHTLMVVSVAHTANPSLYKLKYDTEKAFTPIAQLAAGVSVLAVHPDVPAKTVRELITYIHANPGKLQMAHAGVGTFQHMSSSLLMDLAKVDVVLVPFKGGGPATIDVVAGHTQMAIFTLVQVTGHVRSGKLRALGVGSPERHPRFPDLPTIAEAGVPGYEADNWWGIVGPAGIPKAIADRLANEIVAVQGTPELQSTLDKEGGHAVKRTGAAFAAYLSGEMTKWARVIKQAGIKP